jgi:hypothetical protein
MKKWSPDPYLEILTQVEIRHNYEYSTIKG